MRTNYVNKRLIYEVSEQRINDVLVKDRKSSQKNDVMEKYWKSTNDDVIKNHEQKYDYFYDVMF